MKITVRFEGLADDLAPMVSVLVQWQVTLLRDYVLPTALSMIRGIGQVRDSADALRAAVLGEEEEVEEEEADPEAWPYSRHIPLTSCDECGWLTCRCEQIEAELEGMTSG